MKNKYPVTDHYDGHKFFNPGLNIDKSFLDFFKWNIKRIKGEWPELVENKFKPQLPLHINKNEAYVTFINHVTYLLQLSSYNMLFDPVFSERVSPFKFGGFKRIRRPGFDIKDLPKIDIVMVSHNHFDHMDLDSLKMLHNKFKPLFVVPLANKVYFKSFDKNINVVELDWWQEHILNGIKITLTPAQHWSARGLFDRRDALWGGFVVENQNNNKFYFMGDTGFSSKMFSAIQKKFGEFDLSFIPIGAYEPRWFMESMHMNPEEAVISHQLLKSKFSLGMHYGTFRLSDESWSQPVIELNQAIERKKITNFETMEVGETKKFIFN